MNFMSKNFDLPENMFYFHNTDLHPLTFVLKWDSKDKFFLRLLNRYMGNVINKPDDHSLVLSVPKMNKYFHKFIPAFDIKYIEDCFTLKDYPDPTKYIIHDSCLINYEKNDIFDCWFHRKKSWIDFSPIPKNILNYFEKDSCYNEILPSKDIDDLCSQASSNSTLDSKKSKDIDDLFSQAPSNNTLHSRKRTRMPYTNQEDYKIVEYIVKYKGAFKVTGTEIWRQMEQANICKIRTWQSMKERYIKYIKWDLISGCKKYPFLNENDLKELRQGLKLEVSTDTQKEALKTKYYEIKTRKLFLDESD
ncbi:uncharacterized protein LOC112687855 isoform X3 [Sipha flava]|nr:uncharacterized protein LOC112687855 isoform X3 [Sipha flava]